MKEFFKSLGLDISFIIIGLISAFAMIRQEEHQYKSKGAKISIWLAGFCFAVFVTPLVIWIVEINIGLIMPLGAQFGACYVCSQFGHETIKMILRIDWRKIDWKGIFNTVKDAVRTKK